MTLVRQLGEPAVAFSARVRRLQEAAIVRSAREQLAAGGDDAPRRALAHIIDRAGIR